MASVAIVARTNVNGLEYLVRKSRGIEWASAEQDAEHFLNMREATRAAMQAPAKFRAFALPASVGLA